MTRSPCRFLVIVLSLTLAIELCVAASPQPRVKLQRDAAGKASVVTDRPAAPAESTTVLEKMTVTDSKIPRRPRPLEAYTGTSFSIQKGGPVYKRSGKRFDVLAGLWHHADEFAEDARFKSDATHASFDLLRIKW